jgi:hypothetical protein
MGFNSAFKGLRIGSNIIRITRTLLLEEITILKKVLQALVLTRELKLCSLSDVIL